MKRTTLLLSLYRWILILPFVCPAHGAEPLKAGVGRRDITPSEPVPMWGYSARHDALSQGTLDSLYSTALVLQANGRKLAIVSLDLGRAPGEITLTNIRHRIKETSGIEISFITASHTHCGPVVELIKNDNKFDSVFRYYKKLEDAIVGSILEADSKLKPVKLSGRVSELENFNFNRQTMATPEPREKSLTVLRFDEISGKPLAILVNFSAHPTLLPDSTMKFSADYVGAMRLAVEDKMNEKVVFVQGAAGDLSADDRFPGGYLGYGKALANEVVKLAVAAKPLLDAPKLDYLEERPMLGKRLDLSDPAVRSSYDDLFFPGLVSSYAQEYSQGISPRLTIAILGEDLAFVGVSGEFFCSHSLRLKKQFPAKTIVFFGYCNGYHQYFPTREAVAEGGSGTDKMSSPVAIGAGEQVMDTAFAMISKLIERNKTEVRIKK